jgi:hypothetical protein
VNEAEEETEQERREKALRNVSRLEWEFARVMEKRKHCDHKRYPVKWADVEPEFFLALPEKEALEHDRDGTDAEPDTETDGGELRCQTGSLQQATGGTGEKPDAFADGITGFEEIIQRCQRSVRELADIVGEIEKRRIEQEQERQARSQTPRMRMR